ncbi:hypothetical protein TPHA_0B03140 [Tetrapisispora phaffii CBS 4417]|uniref:Uncharacterized protein n=1 Tax=Tetrapisispora phaffii (strain ATCC 24235 / CBS 4417 / NBRC 1672 / NRRL Y-8282 / UCD 70-5) TaxID=1071381 RepID=G8BPQ5_TETPH|nr:hypothetical protein TPHA_0B03140 [Tetrapisispora phaffii CBS 4417]CCE61986.1 hypothetical protein TPHA_0B03140 [Tetrapisispora phaffii CBS 4417]
MTSFFHQIKNIFVESHSPYQQILLSRKAFFQFIGFLGGCVIITVATQSTYLD